MPRTKQNFNLAQGAGLGITLGVTLSLFTYLGYKLDQWLGWAPIGLITGVMLGLGSGMYYVIRKVADLERGPDVGAKDAKDAHDRP